jgi:hypothetical protein
MALEEGNRFFRPTVAQYTPQFVEEQYPFGEMLALAERDQAKRDYALGQLGEISKYLQVNADPEQEQHKTALLEDYYGRVNQLSQRLSEGTPPDQVLGALTTINRDWQMDSRRRDLETGYEQGQAYRKDLRAFKATDKYKPWLDTFSGVLGGYEPGSGDVPIYQGVEAYIDPQQSMQSALGQIAKDSELSGDVEIVTDETTGLTKLVNTRTGSGGVDPTKLRGVARNTARFWLKNTGAGQQRMAEMRFKRPDLTEAQIENLTAIDFYNLGANQLGIETTDLETWSFPEGLQTGEREPSYGPDYDRRPDQLEGPKLKLDDLDFREEQPGTGNMNKFGPSTIPAKNYDTLSEQKQADFKRIALHQKKAVQHMRPEFQEEWLRSDEAHSLVQIYLAKREDIQYQPVVDYSRYYDHGNKTDFYTQEEKRIKSGIRGYKLYDMLEKEVLKPGEKRSGKDKRDYKKVAKLIADGKFDLVGDYDPKNFITAKEGDEAWASSWMIKVNFDDDTQKEFLVTKPDDHQDPTSSRGNLNRSVNRVFLETVQYPGIPIDGTITYQNKDFNYEFIYDPTNRMWAFRDKNDPRIMGFVEDLKHTVEQARAIRKELNKQ